MFLLLAYCTKILLLLNNSRQCLNTFSFDNKARLKQIDSCGTSGPIFSSKKNIYLLVS